MCRGTVTYAAQPCERNRARPGLGCVATAETGEDGEAEVAGWATLAVAAGAISGYGTPPPWDVASESPVGIWVDAEVAAGIAVAEAGGYAVR